MEFCWNVPAWTSMYTLRRKTILHFLSPWRQTDNLHACHATGKFNDPPCSYVLFHHWVCHLQLPASWLYCSHTCLTKQPYSVDALFVYHLLYCASISPRRGECRDLLTAPSCHSEMQWVSQVVFTSGFGRINILLQIYTLVC